MDLDMVSYIEDTNVFYNELEAFYPVFMEQIIKNYNIKTTWFLRIDSQMEQIFGSADFSFQENKELLKEQLNIELEYLSSARESSKIKKSIKKY